MGDEQQTIECMICGEDIPADDADHCLICDGALCTECRVILDGTRKLLVSCVEHIALAERKVIEEDL